MKGTDLGTSRKSPYSGGVHEEGATPYGSTADDTLVCMCQVSCVNLLLLFRIW